LTGIMWGIPGPERPGEQLSKRQVLVDRVVTVSGHGVTTPQNLPVPLGTSIGDVIAFCGGASVAEPAVIIGGPMTGMHVTDIPVIASVNAVTSQAWVEYAGQIQHAGADALELNIALMPLNLKEGSDQIEEYICGIVRAVRKATTLPLTVKVGPWFTSLPRIVRELVDAGADGVVLFNRFYQLDIDPVALKPVPGYQYSSPAELPLPLRWVAILSPQIRTQYSLSTGVHSGMDAVKALTAGAQVVQVASVLYLNRVGVLTTMIEELDRWLDDHGYPSVDALRGRLAQVGSYQPEELERLQYIKALTGIS